MVDEVHTRHHHRVICASRASRALRELGLKPSDDSYGRHHHHLLGLSPFLAALRPDVDLPLISMQGGFGVQVGAEERREKTRVQGGL